MPYLFGHKRDFPSLEWLRITKSVLCNLAIRFTLPKQSQRSKSVDFVLEGTNLRLISKEIRYSQHSIS